MNEKSKKVKEAKINKKSHITLQTSQNSGITLVALIITIIVLLILAVVAIRAVQGDGIISHAKNAQTRYEQEQAKEQATLESYLGMLEPEKVATTIEEAQSGAMLSKTVNSTLTDKYGNTIVVPAGFKILVDSTTDYTKETIDVTKGIVIQDASGNEFVWIPVGDVYTTEDTEKTESNTTPITLGRYSNFTATDGVYTPATTDPSVAVDNHYTEGLKDSKTENAHAKDIVAFKTSAITNHGYYIGRYEAGKENNTLVCKANKSVYRGVTQPEASELSQSMYINKPYESDLVNSYAWDTAIVFIQTFGANGVGGKEPNSAKYSSVNKSTGFRNTGLNPDKYRNIYDMSGNAFEWSTETSSWSSQPCTVRGGWFTLRNNGVAANYTSYRICYRTTISDRDNYSIWGPISFRPILYM